MLGCAGLLQVFYLALLALLPRAGVAQTLQQLCDEQRLALFLRHYSTELQSLPDWSTPADVDAADYSQTAAQVMLLPGQQFIDVSGVGYAGDVAFIYQVRPTRSLSRARCYGSAASCCISVSQSCELIAQAPIASFAARRDS